MGKKIGVVLLCLLVLIALGGRARADLLASEGALNAVEDGGTAFEVNPDPQGWLWISDYGAGEVWGLDLQTGFYEIYPVGGSPSDARHDGAYLWWADGGSGLLGRASTQDGAYETWAVQGADNGLYGTALDAQGRFWALDAVGPYLYRLEQGIDAQPDVLCTYTIPENGVSNYLARDGDYLWLGDLINSRLLRINTTSDNPTYWSAWSLPSGSTPFALAVDEQGNVWYTDDGNAALVRLDPDAVEDQLAVYNLPQGIFPTMLALQGGLVWYTEQDPASLGVLDPQAASSTPFTPEVETPSISSTCEDIAPSETGWLTITLGEMDWQTASYPTLVDADGWRIYDLPDGAAPWGIASAGGIWFVDNGRQVLGKIEVAQNVYLPLIIK